VKDSNYTFIVLIMRFISDFYFNSRLVKDSNYTFIVLIPKVGCPKKLYNFYMISLVGCMYKILAKVLANILKLVINSVIFESHSVFVKDR